MATSLISQIEASFLTQIVAGTTLEGALAGTQQAVGLYPWAFVGIAGGPVTYLGNSQMDVEYTVTVLVESRDCEITRYAIEELLGLFTAWNGSNAMYNLGVFWINPTASEIPTPINPPANDSVFGTVTYTMKVRYSYA